MINIVDNVSKNDRLKIGYIATGGTAASTRGENGLRPTLLGEEILERVPQVYSLVGGRDYIHVVNFVPQIDSRNMAYEDRVRLAKEIQELRRQGYDAVVITHGTDQMANTAAALSFLRLYKDSPVILTGGRHSPEHPRSDVPANLLGAFVVAANKKPPLKGDVVYFDCRLLRGTRTVKIGGKFYFDSPHYSPIAETLPPGFMHKYPTVKLTKNGAALQDDFERRNAERFAEFEGEVFDYPPEITDRVGSVEVFTDANTDDVARMAKNWHGVVVKGWGEDGGIPTVRKRGKDSWSELLQNWCEDGKVVVVASKLSYGVADLTEYETGAPLLKAGAIASYDMPSDTALEKLRWAFGLLMTGPNEKRPDAATRDIIKRFVRGYNVADEINLARVPQELWMPYGEAETIFKKFLERRPSLSTRYVKALLRGGDGHADIHKGRRPEVPTGGSASNS